MENPNINPENELPFEQVHTDPFEDYENDKAYWAAAKADQDAWKLKWPNYCAVCGGWGGFHFPGKFSGPPEECYPDDWDECDALPVDMCHRCKGQMHSFGEENPKCQTCGWSWDDGIPQF